MEYINYKLVVDDKDVLGYLRELEGKGLFNMPTYSPSGTETSFGNLFNGDDKMVSLERFTHSHILYLREKKSPIDSPKGGTLNSTPGVSGSSGAIADDVFLPRLLKSMEDCAT